MIATFPGEVKIFSSFNVPVVTLISESSLKEYSYGELIESLFCALTVNNEKINNDRTNK